MNDTVKEKPVAWSLNSELLFVAGIGTHSRLDLISARTLLRRYDEALDRRSAWWPGFKASDVLALKSTVAQRLEQLAIPA